IEALAVLPAPPSVEVTAPLTLFLTPAVVPVTFTATVQVPVPGMDPPLNVSVVSPGLGANVPPQDAEAPGVVATCNPDGSESVNPPRVSVGVALGLFMVSVRWVLPQTGMGAAPTCWALTGGDGPKTGALAVFPVPPLAEVTAPLVLFFTPPVVAVMFTTTV